MRQLFIALCSVAMLFTTPLAAQQAVLFDKEIQYDELTPAEQTAARREARQHRYKELTFCADPGNMPLSNKRREGLQNKIAEAVARQMGANIKYFWRPYLERGLTRETFANKECEILIEIPYGYENILTSEPIYRSTYVFATRNDSGVKIDSLDDEVLRQKKVGVFQHSGMREALARHGIKDGLELHVISHDADLKPEKQPWQQVRKVIDGKLDIAAIWGPFAGWLVAKDEPLNLTPANLMEDEVVLEFDLAFGVRTNDVILKYALDYALQASEKEITAILKAFGVPLVACSKCTVQGELPSHGTFYQRFAKVPQERFLAIKPGSGRQLDPSRASDDQLVTIARLKAALDSGADVDIEFTNAVLAADKERVEFLLQHGAAIDKRNLQGSPALTSAAKSRDTDMVATLLDNGADVLVTDLNGWQALHHAVLRNHVPTIELLVENGADPSARAPGGQTPLTLAISEGKRWAAKALIDAGADVDQAVTGNNLTPLMILATQGETFNRDARVAGGPSVQEIATMLVKMGVDVDSVTDQGVTALMIAASHDNALIIGLLASAGADFSQVNNEGRAALDIAKLTRSKSAEKAIQLFTIE
ncbi:MAG: quinoprotein dehydrogenase-associated putative ABC transporter substrate-binding protein [Granulosicoccus sp.]